jgi:hypothetical protein
LSRIVLVTTLAGFLTLSNAPFVQAGQSDEAKSRLQLLSPPLHFERNEGQADPAVKFLSRGGGSTLLLMPGEVVLRWTKGSPSKPETLGGATLRMKFASADVLLVLTGVDELAGKVNYLIGGDPSRWRTNVATFAKVRYESIYPGIDVVFYGNERELEFDFVVAPGADPRVIAFTLEGADEVVKDAEGNLRASLHGKEVVLRAPFVYQEENGRRREIVGRYAARTALSQDSVAADVSRLDQSARQSGLTSAATFGFDLAAHDPALPLVIDPVISFSTYLGGSGFDTPYAIAVDGEGNTYVTGFTQSADFPTANPLDATFNDSDAFVVKLKADGSGFDYATYLGGGSSDSGSGIGVDSAGNAYITGYTWSGSDFPLVNPIHANHRGNTDAFVVKLNAAGNAILYSTFLGGDSGDSGRGIAVDAAGAAYVIGVTSSSDFPTTPGALQTARGGGVDAFVAKVNPAGSALVYCTYLGGTADEGSYTGLGVAVDALGNACVEGNTASTNFPTTAGAFQPAFGGGGSDAFVAKLNVSGTAFIFSTYLGGSETEPGYGDGIAVDAAGNIYVCGATASANFPTTNAWQPTMQSRWTSVGGNGFVSKLNSDGSNLVYSTFLLGVAYTGGIAVDHAGNAYVVGVARENFPIVNAVQTNHGGGDDGFLLKLDPDGQSALYATYLGGANGDGCTGIAVDANGSAYVAGNTSSTNFPTQNAIQPGFGGGASDGFVVRISDPDTNPPVILAASNYGDANVVTIDFSEALDVASATNTAHYAFDHGVTVSSATMGINSKTVRLLTSGLTNGVAHTLTVNGVLDRAPVPNPIAANTTATFTAMNLYRGFLRQENYSGIQPAGDLNALISHAKFPDQPDTTTTLHEFEIVPGAHYQDGLRLRGWLLPPVTGEYAFYLHNVSQATLSLSRNESPHNMIQLAFEPTGYGPGGRKWNHPVPGSHANPLPNVSLPIHLEAGRAYYVEVVATSSAANVLGVAWRMPGQPVPRDGDPPIPGAYLALLGDPTTASLSIVEQPESFTATEGQSASFTVKATASGAGIYYQWRRNGVELPGANTSSFIASETTLADGGTVYDCVLTIPGATVTSSAALLTVTNDVTPPVLVSAEGNLTLTNITLIFSEAINSADATNTANYVLSGGLIVSNAALLVDRRTVILTTSPQTPGSNYTVQVTGVRDRSAAGNSVTVGTQSSFFGWVDEEFVGPFPSWANVKTAYGAIGDGVADDTAALQQALNEVATPGHAAVLYFPAGTYRITQTLNFTPRLSAGLIGEDPTNTILKWDGAPKGEMLFANGVAQSRWMRLTWDGSGKAEVAVHHGNTGGGFHVTGNLHADEIFRDIGAGLVVDPANGGDTHLIVRCHFLRCSLEGIATSSYNAIDWHVWDSVFEDCAYGLISFTGNFHVYRSLFLRSTEMDIRAGQGYTGIRGNLSIGSKTFVNNREEGHTATIQGNTILNALDPTPIRWPGGSVILLDNTVVTGATPANAPAVAAANNLTSAGNTFTVFNPIAVGGRSSFMEDRVVGLDSFSPPPVMVPRFLPKSSSPIIEVPAGANAETIQQAINTAAGLNGQRPIVHLPAGGYQLDRTLVIPANCDLQLVGDGISFSGTRLHGPDLPGVPVLFLAGPSRATLRGFDIVGTGLDFERAQGTGIAIENCDQPGARVFMEQLYLTYSRSSDLIVDRLDHTDVSLHDFSGGIYVIGGAMQAMGQATTGRVVQFGGASAGTPPIYRVERGGRLMAQDTWFEGEARVFMGLTDSGTFTLNNATIAAGDPNHGGARDGTLEFDDFHGSLTFLNVNFRETTVSVFGDGSDTDLLLLGCNGSPNTTPPTPATYLDNRSLNARAEHWFSSSGSREVPHATEPDPVFLRNMLAQVRTETPRRLVPLPNGVTDLRIYGISIEKCKFAMILSGSNAPPELPPLPVQFGNEESLLLVTNIVTGPDAPYGLYAFALGSGTPTGMSIDPDTGVIRWTPTEAQGPSTNNVSVIATAISSPLLKATNVVTIIIQEDNRPPVLLADRRLIGVDIGAPPSPGSTTYQPDGTIEVVASGAGPYVPGDDFHFSYEQVTGDFDFGVQIVSLEAVAPGTSAGIMARASLDFDSPTVYLTLQPPPPVGSDYSFWAAYREVVGELAKLWNNFAGSGTRYPTWFRLQRQDQSFRALRSYNGTTWQQVDQVTLSTPFPNRLYIGLCTWSWAAGHAPAPETRAVYRDYRNYPVSVSHAITNRTVNEGAVIRFQALAQDPDTPSVLTFSLDPGAPEGASIDPVTGLFTWIPSEAQGPGNHSVTVRVTDNGSPPLSDAKTFIVTVNEVNQAPAIAPIPNQAASEGAAFMLAPSVTDPDLPANRLAWSLGPGAPVGMSLDPAAGALAWTPDETQGGASYPITVTITDDGVPPLSDTKTFTVAVAEVNSAPQLAVISDQSVDELSELTFAAAASDGDLPPQPLTFSLAPGAPEGATISPEGVFRWTPTEAQGPSTNVIFVAVSDDGSPSLSATQSFTVIVLESNSPPSLSPIADRTIHAGSTLVISNTATDADLPPNTLNFALNVGAPAGGSIDDKGVFMWPTSEADANTANPITVRVTDDGTPPLADAKSFNVTVVGRPVLQTVSVSNNVVTLRWSAIPGQRYRLQSKENLDDPDWMDVPGETIADGTNASTSVAIGAQAQQFFRITVAP